MSRKKRYIKPLSDEAKKALEKGKKSKVGSKFNQRCHAILLSSKGYSTNQLMEIFSVTRNTIFQWFDRYEDEGISGLKTRPGQGRKSVLRIDNKKHVQTVEKAVAKVNEKGGNLLAEVEADLDLEEGLTKKILRSFLKRLVSSGNAVAES